MVVVVVACSNVFPRELKLDKEILDSEGNYGSLYVTLCFVL